MNSSIQPVNILLPAKQGAGIPWGHFLVMQMLNLIGLRFSLKPLNMHCLRWSALIWDLIGGVSRYFSKGMPRGHGVEALVQIISTFNRFDNPENSYIEFEGDRGGLSLFMVIVSDRESLA